MRILLHTGEPRDYPETHQVVLPDDQIRFRLKKELRSGEVPLRELERCGFLRKTYPLWSMSPADRFLIWSDGEPVAHLAQADIDGINTPFFLPAEPVQVGFPAKEPYFPGWLTFPAEVLAWGKAAPVGRQARWKSSQGLFHTAILTKQEKGVLMKVWGMPKRGGKRDISEKTRKEWSGREIFLDESVYTDTAINGTIYELCSIDAEHWDTLYSVFYKSVANGLCNDLPEYWRSRLTEHLLYIVRGLHNPDKPGTWQESKRAAPNTIHHFSVAAAAMTLILIGERSQRVLRALLDGLREAESHPAKGWIVTAIKELFPDMVGVLIELLEKEEPTLPIRSMFDSPARHRAVINFELMEKRFAGGQGLEEQFRTKID